jgi:hypothetical protein
MPTPLSLQEFSSTDIFQGALCIAPPSTNTLNLIDYAADIVAEVFDCALDSIVVADDAESLGKYVNLAKCVKSKFTNSGTTKEILESLILEKYSCFRDVEGGIFYDVPRLRIIPPSRIISSGISYNYRPHRDTWYGSCQEQINHWISVANVSSESTFFIAPSFFRKSIQNSSETFDLDRWAEKYRPAATLDIKTETRPHPMPIEAIEETEFLLLNLPVGWEVAFSTQHLHGSYPNTTLKTRISIDYRVVIPSLAELAPENIDSKATGDYYKDMLKIST